MIAVKLNTHTPRRAMPATARAEAPASQPATRGRARQRRPQVSFGWAAVGIIVLCAIALVYVSETAAATQASYQITSLKAEQRRLLAEQEQVRYEISLASSAGRLDADARRIGLVQTPNRVYVPSGANPIALARTEPGLEKAPARTFLDQLAVALGRPTEAQAKGR
jgi:hypothetical protein